MCDVEVTFMLSNHGSFPTYLPLSVIRVLTHKHVIAVGFLQLGHAAHHSDGSQEGLCGDRVCVLRQE